MSLLCELSVSNTTPDTPLAILEPEPVESAEAAVHDEPAADTVESRLLPHHLAELRRSGLSDEQILGAELRSSQNPQNIANNLNRPLSEVEGFGPCLAFPFLMMDGNRVVWNFARYKPDHPPAHDGKPAKYLSPAGEKGKPNRLYIPPGTRTALAEPQVPLIITEGEKKSLKADQEGFPCVGLTGVYNWVNTRKSKSEPKKLIPDMALIPWKGRTVFICFDSDMAEKEQVQFAQRDLAAVLSSHGANVLSVHLPHADDGKKVGLDDYLVAHTPDQFRELLAAAKPIALPDVLPDGIVRKPRGAYTKNAGDEPENPHRLAAELLDHGGRGDRPLWLRYWRETFYEWTGACYRKASDAAVKALVSNFARQVFVEQYKLKRIAYNDKAKEGERPPTVIPVTVPLVNNVLNALKGLCAVPDTTDAPAYLDGDTGPDPRFLLAGPNGLFDLAAAADGEGDVILEPNPDLFNLTKVDYELRGYAPDPKAWLAFLSQLWPDDVESIDCLQEWFGYVLSGDTSHQKMLWMIGPSRAGKGTISHVLTMLVGKANVATPGLHDLASDFGLQSLLDKSLALVPDGRLSSKADAVLVTSRLLQIVGEDGIDVNRKGKAILENVRLGCRVVVAANELPALVDQSEAMLARSLVLRFTRTFRGQEDIGLKKKLDAELPGILLWAVKGLARLKANGRFTEPSASEELKQELADLLSPVGAFVREKCIVDGLTEIRRTDLFAAWKSWCESENRTQPGTQEIFGRNLRSVLPALKDKRVREGDDRVRLYVGIRLREPGDADPDYPPTVDQRLDHRRTVQRPLPLGLPG